MSNVNVELLKHEVDSFDWESCGLKFYIGQSQIHEGYKGGKKMYIEARLGPDTTNWVVLMDGRLVLGKDNRFHYEPQPSSRSDEFINNTRFNTKEEALEALFNYEQIKLG